MRQINDIKYNDNEQDYRNDDSQAVAEVPRRKELRGNQGDRSLIQA